MKSRVYFISVKNSDTLQLINQKLKRLLDEKTIKDVKDIAAIGHRVVHGGETFYKPSLINAEVINFEE